MNSLKPSDTFYNEVSLMENTCGKLWSHSEDRNSMLYINLRCVPSLPFSATMVTLRSILMT